MAFWETLKGMLDEPLWGGRCPKCETGQCSLLRGADGQARLDCLDCPWTLSECWRCGGSGLSAGDLCTTCAGSGSLPVAKSAV